MGLARLLVAAATWRGGHELVHMSKAWRSDVSSFYTTNGPQNAELRRESGPLNTTEVWYEHRDHVAAECDGCVGFARGTEPPFQCPNTEFANHCGWCGNGGGPNAPACRFHEQRYVLTPSLGASLRGPRVAPSNHPCTCLTLSNLSSPPP